MFLYLTEHTQNWGQVLHSRMGCYFRGLWHFWEIRKKRNITEHMSCIRTGTAVFLLQINI